MAEAERQRTKILPGMPDALEKHDGIESGEGDLRRGSGIGAGMDRGEIREGEDDEAEFLMGSES